MTREGLLDLNEAVQHPGTKLRFEIATELRDEEDLDLLEPVAGALEAQSTGNILLVRAEFCVRCVLECARCGEPLTKEVEFQMSDEFMVEGTPGGFGTGGQAVVQVEDGLALFKHNSLICDNYVRQGLIVNLPQQPLCEHGWDGPCPNAERLARPDRKDGHPALQRLRDLLPPEEAGNR
ncbi:MAG: hypothetical protein IIC73_02205 [Armatimonadetes bacterium]|nr:hypothetical protein [Armatimonadota bacterium]